jgi:SSS family solute:Na+ symporter
VLGMIKLTIQAFFGMGKIESPALLAAIGDFNFLYATGILFAISAVIIVVASLLTEPPPEEKIKGLTYGSIHREAGDEIKKSWDLGNKVMTAVILICVLTMYLYFSFWLK